MRFVLLVFLLSFALQASVNVSRDQRSDKLDPKVIQLASSQNGSPDGNQSASMTSLNNFINFCSSKEALSAKLTNGTQSPDEITCNPIPMGMIVPLKNAPSCRFQQPKNFDKLKADTAFKMILKIKNLETGSFVNPKTNYFSAPQVLSKKTHNVIGHAHVVAQKIKSLTSTEVLRPDKFEFFKGIDVSTDEDGYSSVILEKGLPAGAYRVSTLLSAANHQPILAGVAQRGAFDDVIYFTVE
ncbi:hypothetical protein BY996DRAFT_6431342 [Phakopsora pachyrhizi]|nr:hypothetical protein BY996DRAFT_6431342 [Phakopsora pachyrhizi]